MCSFLQITGTVEIALNYPYHHSYNVHPLACWTLPRSRRNLQAHVFQLSPDSFVFQLMCNHPSMQFNFSQSRHQPSTVVQRGKKSPSLLPQTSVCRVKAIPDVTLHHSVHITLAQVFVLTTAPPIHSSPYPKFHSDQRHHYRTFRVIQLQNTKKITTFKHGTEEFW